jgi:hypothetical protein
MMDPGGAATAGESVALRSIRAASSTISSSASRRVLPRGVPGSETELGEKRGARVGLDGAEEGRGVGGDVGDSSSDGAAAASDGDAGGGD